ncbi:MAG TPA: TetR/AcrR family transcriptional regulator [Streptosporangiaceae bacterium]|jgi:AcrR family transcriptional regulator|nr:TetR/AcrR family transcriptional regulator [Streptosporangiaceae bacterium]
MNSLPAASSGQSPVPADISRNRGHTPAGRRGRERILQAALDLITEVGIDRVRLAEIARRASMSSGQVMYYFSSKEQILLDTLAWREHQETEQRRAALPAVQPGWPRLELFVELFLPTSLTDPVWIMWMEAWARAPHSKEVNAFLDKLMKPWRDDLAEIVEQGISQQTFQPIPSAAGFAMRFCATLDGLAVLRLIQMPDLSSGELTEMAMRSARAELAPGTAA